MSFSLLTLPSTIPLLSGRVRPACTAALSRCTPERSSGIRGSDWQRLWPTTYQGFPLCVYAAFWQTLAREYTSGPIRDGFGGAEEWFLVPLDPNLQSAARKETSPVALGEELGKAWLLC